MRFPNKPLLLAHVLGMLILTAPAAAAHASGPATTATIPSDAITTARTITALNLRPEPNTTRPPIAVIPGGATIDVLGRNNAATWLFAVYQGQQGWVSAYYVVLASSTPSDLPIVSPSGTPTTPTIPTTPATTFSPYIHNITPHARQIYLDGQAKGNHADVFSKVGDSITEDSAFLFPIGDGYYVLRDYGYLQPVVNYFLATRVRGGNSFNNPSLAAVWGWSTFDLLNPDKVSDTCPGLTPLECEYSTIKPALAIVMIGTNDAIPHYDLGGFEGNIRQIIEASIDRGVIPVMSTVPYDQFTDVQPYNEIIVAMAIEYDVPWMDFYEAIWDLENHGISPDGVHPSVPPTNDPANFSSSNLRYGQTVRNLLVLHVLDAMWRQVLAY